MVIGRIGGFRGLAGEMTIRVASGVAVRWTGLRRVGLRSDPDSGSESSFEVETARAYGERLVLKLRGVDDPSAVENLRGRWVCVPAEAIPELPEGEHFAARLVGLNVEDARFGPIGIIVDVLNTGGADLLIVKSDAGEEVLIPFARAIATHVADDCVHVCLPEGLLELNRRTGGPQ